MIKRRTLVLQKNLRDASVAATAVFSGVLMSEYGF